MTTNTKDIIIKEFENRINNKINTQYNIFYIQPYNNGTKYGVIFNNNQIALCNSISELEQIIKTMEFLLNRGIK